MTPYYDRNGITIYHGDCREVLPSIQRADVVLADPPYGVGLGSRLNNSRQRDEYSKFSDEPADVAALVNAIWPHLVRIAPRIVVTPGVKMLFEYPKPAHVGAFYYPAGAGCNKWGFSCWQPILFYGPDPYAGSGSRPDSFTSTESAPKNGHPCPKPIGQWKWLVGRTSKEGDLLLDPMMGSGTTLRAAKDLGRRAIGIELDERYCEIAAKRLSQEVLQFDEDAA